MGTTLAVARNFALALFGKLRSAPELTRTAFDCRFLSRMPYRKLRAPRRCHEVPWQVDLVPSLTDEPLSLDWALISPSGPDRISILAVLGSDRSWLGRLVRTKGPKIIATPAVTGVRSRLRPVAHITTPTSHRSAKSDGGQERAMINSKQFFGVLKFDTNAGHEQRNPRHLLRSIDAKGVSSRTMQVRR
jgi:hypothetical protein